MFTGIENRICSAHVKERTCGHFKRLRRASLIWLWAETGDILRETQGVGQTQRFEVTALGYAVKEIFYSLQGEGVYAGRPAVFCRFAGCNLWSGKEKDREKAVCKICDTDFVGTDGKNGDYYRTSHSLAEAILNVLPRARTTRSLVVLTGGEPSLQLDEELVACLHDLDVEIALETNGTLSPPPGIDWVCVSPKSQTDLKLRSGDELKLVFPQDDLDPESFEHLSFSHFFLQPLHNTEFAENTRLTVDYCLKHPKWRLSLQIHKLIGIP
jgi:7-carboxy-7-deazaguanine synthase